MSKTRILLADDHAVLRAGLKLLINGQPDMEVAGEATTGNETVLAARELVPDLVLLDISMPGMGGLEALRQMKREQPELAVLVLTMHEDVDYLRQALGAGAAGYVPKSAADVELLSALRAVVRGGVYIHPSHARTLLEEMLPQGKTVRGGPGDPLDALSDREREVLRLVALGHTNAQIAEQLCLSVKTVESYRARMMEKLGLRSRAALVRYALERGLVS
ncbi:MAG: response regulator transcription factor [Chloroflexi bacterium]|nr:response regulator transcription factor [Chloroflexota bacterium]